MSPADSVSSIKSPLSLLDFEPLIRKVRQASAAAFAIAEDDPIESDAVHHLCDSLSSIAEDMRETFDRLMEQRNGRATEARMALGMDDDVRVAEIFRRWRGMLSLINVAENIKDDGEGEDVAFKALGHLANAADAIAITAAEIPASSARALAMKAIMFCRTECGGTFEDAAAISVPDDSQPENVLLRSLITDTNAIIGDEAVIAADNDALIIECGRQIDTALKKANSGHAEDDVVNLACEIQSRLSALIAKTPANSFSAIATKLTVFINDFEDSDVQNYDIDRLRSVIADCERLANERGAE